jgi:hypothetical protein
MLAGQPQPEQPVDVVLVLDNSGSMRKTDPQGLMRKAVGQFAAQLTGSARLAIIRFDDEVEPLLGLTDASGQSFATQVGNAVQRVDYSGQLTDIPAGMERALYELRERGRADARKTIVFFTDGIVDVGSPAKNLERARWLREQLAQDAKQGGISVFGVAFTEAADFELIQSVAQVTGGEYYRVLAASDIAGTFERIGARLRDGPRAAASEAGNSVLVSVPGPTPTPGPWWPWVVGAAALLIGVAAVVTRRRATLSKPGVTATLRDIGGHSGREKHMLHKRLIRIGRDPTWNDIVIPHDTVSGRHAEIEFRGGAFYLRDLRSSNKTFLNAKEFSSPDENREVVLKHGDRMRFDAYEFEFVVAGQIDIRKTRLVGEAVAVGTRPRGQPPAAIAELPPGATVPKPVETQPKPDEAEAQTRLKAEMCPNHPAWKAAELCLVCKKAFCKYCITEKNGRRVCIECAKTLTA